MANRMRDDGHGVAIAGGFFRILLYVCVIFAIIYVGKTAYSFGYDIFNQVPVSQGEGKDVTVVIKDGTSVYKIGKILKNKGLIDDGKVFVVQEKLSNYKDKLQAGTYILNTSQTADEMMAILARENTEGQPEQEDKEEDGTKDEADKTADENLEKVSQDPQDGDDAQSGEGDSGEDGAEGGQE
ncbi:endolytic transglycosylase MltG [Lactonifactor longoviformis]|uniref:endolytic transglycosylase MltG n=1 Tax=Lactonifactor longoviformis TaxID=341220 RepID=UPI001D01B74C|nr:endolytic transglycosylase MltG [Lactonifactor longoviformis]MCB5712296.1 endolytic transglycosylase MltG [Lactonifactor longoviformis]MCB5716340.1 endolytic transglycosylase MltG [Lactonifactor longoviformis]